MPTPADLEPFLAKLAGTPSPPDTVNPWSDETPYGAIRRNNLRLFFEQLLERDVRTMLVGEAPGYQGCRRTGVGFTSEPQLIGGIPELELFGEARGYRLTGEFSTMRKEPSATIVWGELARHRFTPVIWSAFPFHPHKPGNPLSNRAPKRAEIEFGRGIVLDLMEAFQIERVFAVGNVGHASLAAAGIDAPKVRHPSQGGKNDFVAGIEWVVSHPNELGRVPRR